MNAASPLEARAFARDGFQVVRGLCDDVRIRLLDVSREHLRPELTENRRLMDSAVAVVLEPGDVLFFHCRLFHAAGMNLTDRIKYSVVFTYHTSGNRPIPGTRSTGLPGIR